MSQYETETGFLKG